MYNQALLKGALLVFLAGVAAASLPGRAAADDCAPSCQVVDMLVTEWGTGPDGLPQQYTHVYTSFVCDEGGGNWTGCNVRTE